MSIAENLQRLVDAKEDIIDAILEKGGTVNSGDGFEDFPADIRTITSGTPSTLITKTITENDTYNAQDDNADGYSSVTVNVPQPVITTTRAAANLTEYTQGDTDLGNGFSFDLTSGTAAVGSETVGGVTYNGLAVNGDTSLVKDRGGMSLAGDFHIAEFEFIEKNLTYDSYYGTVRVISTGGLYFEGSSYFSGDSDYMRFCWHGATRLDPEHQIDLDGGSNLYDTTITKASVMNAVLNIKYVSDGDFITLYVNDVARLMWNATGLNPVFNAYSLKLGSYGVGQHDMLITKAEYRGESLSWDGRTWAPK